AGAQGLRYHNAGGENVHSGFAAIIRLATIIPQPIPPAEDLLPPLLCGLQAHLLDAPGGESHIQTLAMLPIEQLLEAPAQNALQFPAIGRLEIEQVRHAHADE